MCGDHPNSSGPGTSELVIENQEPPSRVPAESAARAREAMVHARALVARLRESGNPEAVLCPLPPSERGLFTMNTMGWVIGDSQVDNSVPGSDFRMPFRWIMTAYGRLVTDLENPAWHSISWPKDSDLAFWQGAVDRLRAVADKHGVGPA